MVDIGKPIPSPNIVLNALSFKLSPKCFWTISHLFLFSFDIKLFFRSESDVHGFVGPKALLSSSKILLALTYRFKSSLKKIINTSDKNFCVSKIYIKKNYFSPYR